VVCSLAGQALCGKGVVLGAHNFLEAEVPAGQLEVHVLDNLVGGFEAVRRLRLDLRKRPRLIIPSSQAASPLIRDAFFLEANLTHQGMEITHVL
jgi:hypothetical protein